MAVEYKFPVSGDSVEFAVCGAEPVTAELHINGVNLAVISFKTPDEILTAYDDGVDVTAVNSTVPVTFDFDKRIELRFLSKPFRNYLVQDLKAHVIITTMRNERPTLLINECQQLNDVKPGTVYIEDVVVETVNGRLNKRLYYSYNACGYVAE